MQELILLGAGASMDAGLPSALSATSEIVKSLKNQENGSEPCLQILQYVIGCLLADKGRKLENPLDGVDVEAVYNALMFLADLGESDAFPFIQSWDPMISKFDLVGPNLNFIAPNLDLLTRALDEDAWTSGAVLESLMLLVSTYRLRDGRGKPFRETANVLSREMRKLCMIKDKTKVEYLVPLFNCLKGQDELPIVTLNYDLGIELAAELSGKSLNTGISSWSEHGYIDFSGNGIQLLKVHGSIDWRLKRLFSDRDKPLRHCVIEQLEDDELEETIKLSTYDQDPTSFDGPVLNVLSHDVGNRERETKAVIFGNRNKLTTEGPFLALLMAFRQFLENTDRVTIIGYSFRDAHINDLLVEWINSNIKNKLRIISPSFPREAGLFGAELLKLKAHNRVEMIKAKAKDGIATIFGAS